jgi:hypothetical protein
MSTRTQAGPSAKRSGVIADSTLIRAITFINFLLLGLMASPLPHGVEGRMLDALRRTGTGDLSFGGLQLWAIGSTLLATVLFVRRAVATARMGPRSLAAQRGLLVDGLLLAAWWLTLLGLLAYGYMLGMGG